MAKAIILQLDQDKANPAVTDLFAEGALRRFMRSDEAELRDALLREGVPEAEASSYVAALRRGDEVFTLRALQGASEPAVDTTNRNATAVLPTQETEALTVPLRKDAHGVLYVSGTRVPLSVLLEDYRNGAEADDLALSYPTLRLEDIYAVLSYYLRHRDTLDAYLQEQLKRAEQQRLQTLERFPQADLRARLLARVR